MMHIFERAFSRPNCRHPRCNAWWRLRNEACFQTPQCHHRNTPDTPLRQCLAYKSFHRDHFPFLKDWKPLGVISVEWENPRTCFTPIDWRFTIKLMERTQRKMEWNGTGSVLKASSHHLDGWIGGDRLDVYRNWTAVCRAQAKCSKPFLHLSAFPVLCKIQSPAEYYLPWTTSPSCL